MAAGTVNLPPGFEIEQSSPVASAPSSLPPGFELENQPQDTGMSWSGLGKNAVNEIPRMAMGTGQSIKEGLYDIPRALFTAPRDILRRNEPATPQPATTPSMFSPSRYFPPTDNLAQFTTKRTQPMAEGISQAIQHPIDTAYKNPIQTGMMLYGGLRAGRSMFAGAEPNILERAGARGINASAGIRPQTIEDLTGYGKNPGEVGVKLGGQLAKEGIAGKGATGAYKQAMLNQNQYGTQIDQALAQLKSKNKLIGTYYPEFADPLKVESNPVLKPLIDKANDLGKSGYPMEKFESRVHRAAYNSLSDAAEKNRGMLSLDNVRDEMQKVGKMMNGASDEHYSVLSKLYGTLADTRDAMVNEIASQAGDPSLVKNLMDANANYSRYARILPDMRRAAASEGVGKNIIEHPFKMAARSIQPLFSKGTYGTGRALRNVFGAVPTGGEIGQGIQKRAGNETGSIRIGPGMTRRDLTPSEDTFLEHENNYRKHMNNYDFENALKDKWGMLRYAESNTDPMSSTPSIEPPLKQLTKQMAKDYLKKAKGDRNIARQMAEDDGWSF